jgi:lipopolysaccharide exporter
MVFSTVAMQLISILTIPILARLFSPESFGTHGSYRSLIIIISLILSFSLELAVVLPKGDFEKVRVYLTTFITVFSTAAIILILYYCALFFFNIDFFTFLFNKSDSSYIYIVLLGAILVAITNLNQSRLVSLKMFKKIAISRFILPLFFFIFSIFFYYLDFKFSGLIYAQIVAYLFLFFFLQKFIKLNFKSINKLVIKSIYKKYREIPLFTFPNSLLNTISLNLPLIILGILYSDTVVGYYAIGVKLVSLPVSFVSSSFSQIFYKKCVDLFNHSIDDLFPFVKKVMFILLGIGLIVFLFIYLLIPYLVPFFLGEQWLDSIKYLQYICFWQALMLVNSPVSTIAILLKKQKPLLFFQILYLLFRTLALWFPFHLGFSAKDSVLYYSITGVLFNFYLFYFLLKITYNFKKLNVGL